MTLVAVQADRVAAAANLLLISPTSEPGMRPTSADPLALVLAEAPAGNPCGRTQPMPQRLRDAVTILDAVADVAIAFRGLRPSPTLAPSRYPARRRRSVAPRRSASGLAPSAAPLRAAAAGVEQ